MTAADRGLLPFTPDVEPATAEPETVALEEAAGVVDALAASTTRAVLRALYRDPAPASSVAERLDLTIQNAAYHLGKLRSAGLVAVAETWYSEKGTPMRVYAPASDPLVVVAGRPDDIRTVERAIGRTTQPGAD